MAQDFGVTDELGKQAHSRLRNCFSSTAVESKDKSDSGIIEFSLLRSAYIDHGQSLLSMHVRIYHTPTVIHIEPF